MQLAEYLLFIQIETCFNFNKAALVSIALEIHCLQAEFVISGRLNKTIYDA